MLMVNYQVIELTRINRKIDLIAITVSYNCYQLNAQPSRT
jgi:hypothetical protein